MSKCKYVRTYNIPCLGHNYMYLNKKFKENNFMISGCEIKFRNGDQMSNHSFII